MWYFEDYNFAPTRKLRKKGLFVHTLISRPNRSFILCKPDSWKPGSLDGKPPFFDNSEKYWHGASLELSETETDETIVLKLIVISYRRSQMIHTKTELFDAVENLSIKRPFRRRDIEKILSVKLRSLKNESNEYFTKYKSLKDIINKNFEIAVQLRLPKSRSKHLDGLLILRIKSDIRISQNDVIERFGSGGPIPPDPGMPADEAQLEIAYDYSWGKITFGLSPYEPQCLNFIVMDAID